MNPKYHNLLKRQLKKLFGESFSIPEEWQGFIEAVNMAYYEFDDDRYMLERSLELSSQELLQANSEMRAIFEALPDLFFRFTYDGIILDCKAGNSSDLYIMRENIIGKKIEDIPTPEVATKFREATRQVRETLSNTQIEYSLMIGENEHFYEARLLPILDNQIIAMIRNVTEQRHAAQAIKEVQMRLADIIDFLPDATLVIDRKGKVIAWNRAMESMTNVNAEEMLGKDSYEYALPFYGTRRPLLIDLALHPDLGNEKLYTSIQKTGDLIIGESFTRMLSSGRIHLSATASVLRDSRGEIIGAIECIRDNTDRKNMEERLYRAEKMEALGQLAGGVAHDLNNVLGILSGYSELLLMEMPEGHQSRGHVETILQSTEKGAAIIQDLLTLARRGVAASNVINLNSVVSGFLKSPVFEKMKGYFPRITFRTECDNNLLNIKGSSVHMEKTLMNLVSNAAESIPGEGEVTIRTENRYLDKAIKGYDEVQEGDYAVLSVSDTGMGISPEHREKIFEPFFTKKTMGRSGTGLGLAIVWGTVKDHNGYIDVQTEVGKGATFTVFLPVTREELSAQQQKEPMERYMGKGESVLVVDDIAEQRNVASGLLTRLGYNVRVVPSGEKAVEYLKGNRVDILVLDMIMDPGIDGLETYRRVLDINPKQKAIIVSGFSETARVKEAHKLGAGAYVKKPYVIEKIGMAIRDELARK